MSLHQRALGFLEAWEHNLRVMFNFEHHLKAQPEKETTVNDIPARVIKGFADATGIQWDDSLKLIEFLKDVNDDHRSTIDVDDVEIEVRVKDLKADKRLRDQGPSQGSEGPNLKVRVTKRR
jgi:hypothetical protein